MRQAEEVSSGPLRGGADDVGVSGIFLGKPEKDKKEEGLYRYPLTYAEDYQCTILYCPTHETDDSEENVKGIYDILFAPLPNGRRY